MDGNKRLAVSAMAWFLFCNEFALLTTSDRLVDFALRVADNRLSRDESARWVESRALRGTWTAARMARFFFSLPREDLREVMRAPGSADFAHELLREFVRTHSPVDSAP